ncbi:TraV family lipoprotein [Enterovibrio paralichthyis]|uniref:TraV family lipoprotein n=1 Tax=Enterovibrio paralichthyis TaxID=2853805 RepID=UPI001C474C0A|nr:TraV family lipoprotein [Enterovibrio paralichthyis]MBV7300271.1 TraV family lipoprotein [Enterovibrio paralichthyis]
MKKITFFALIIAALNMVGCAKSTTVSEFDCPLTDGVSPCLTTADVDVPGDIPKGPGAVSESTPTVSASTSEKTVVSPTGSREKVIEIAQDMTYPVKPALSNPLRKHGNTERMWFKAWLDTENDLFIDQQFIYWTEKGQWRNMEY